MVSHSKNARAVTGLETRARSNGSVVAVPWQFWALHVAALILLLPVVGATRLLPGQRRDHSGESIFAETNRTVLTALGMAFMS